MNEDQSFDEEAVLIAKFIKNVDPGHTFYLCEDKFLLEVLMFVSSELSVLTDSFPDFHSRFSFSEQSKLFLNVCKFPRASFVKFIKYHTACPLASVLNESLPPKPDGFPGHYLIWTGSVKRFLKNVFNTRNFGSVRCLSLELGFGFLQGIKRGCASVSESFLREEVVSHVKAMTTPAAHEVWDEWIDEYSGLPLAEVQMSRDGRYIMDPSTYRAKLIHHDIVTDTFSSCVKAITRNTNRSYDPKPYEPSHNSCFERSRAKGGAYQELVETLNLPLVESEEVYVLGKIVKNKYYELPKILEVLEQARFKYVEHKQVVEMLTPFRGHFDDLVDIEKYFEPIPLPQTGVIPLSEPLKVRVITKGEAVPAYLAKSLQKSMKSYINRFPSLVLTTRPLDPTDFRRVWALESSIEEKYGVKLDFTDHVSGDYKAATDKLDIRLTKLLFEAVMNALNVPELDKEVYRSVLYEQRLVYPKRYSKFLKSHPDIAHLDKTPDGEFFTVDQANGQLMGSILSFPILCLANLACYKLALDEYLNLGRAGKPIHVNVFDLPALVNGDDIYFRSNPVFYKIWLKYIDIAGFKLSVGKNYVHPIVFTINSQCFSYIRGSDLLRETTYLNVGLLIGQSKSGVVGEKLPVWDLYNKVLKGSNNKTVAHNRFLFYHKDSIAQVSKRGNYNLFLPKLLGGLGFVRYSTDIPVRLTRFQLQLALYFHNKIVNAYQKPTIGLSISKARLIDENSPIAYDPYPGESIVQTLKTGDLIPEGYSLPNLIASPEHLMIHQLDESHMVPKLQFRSISNTDLAEFRLSPERQYKGEVAWFGQEDAFTGNYLYFFVKSLVSDQVSFQENLINLCASATLDNIKDLIERELSGLDVVSPLTGELQELVFEHVLPTVVAHL